MTPYEKEAIRRLNQKHKAIYGREGYFTPEDVATKVLATTLEELGWKPVDPVVELYAGMLFAADATYEAETVRDGTLSVEDEAAIAYLRERIPAVAKMMGEG